mmetsp:Transcript_13255/g.25403  ORF Transcript_13255/g.25403 Transcript_13255/m.25403 type:complete len:273 (+) Transcript_13255:300-1118(+)|eukprot:CAMPEP_0114229200 /NCGR_PEP_ID=MMETSP0058-20121206/2776_1 /TAXON_ID=36894 /ORGANISM="Pyramimonas parkeae, CCMP726" /LENGTH=272 /DNA_ID=CAMNT_0001340251 /DNA_START=285 /DNA_END=1103 /DNA_ORIENTATION=-
MRRSVSPSTRSNDREGSRIPKYHLFRSSENPLRAILLCTVFVFFAGLIFYLEGTPGRRAKRIARRASATYSGKLAPATIAKQEYKAAELPGLEAALGVKVLDSTLFASMYDQARASKRGRKMVDLTRNPAKNHLQKMMNTWTEGSYSPVHMHVNHAENFVVLDGALAFFTFEVKEGGGSPRPKCHILGPNARDRGIVIETGEWHAMTAAPTSMGYPGRAIVFEAGGLQFDPSISTKTLAPWTDNPDEGLNGNPTYYAETLLPLCENDAKIPN